MLVQLLDAQSEPHFVAWQGVDQVNDASGSLGAGAVGPSRAFQQLIAANTNAVGAVGCRSGWLFQNTSLHAMIVNESNDTETSGWVVNSGEFFPPPGFPVTVGEIYVMGTDESIEGDTYACREFVNAVGE